MGNEPNRRAVSRGAGAATVAGTIVARTTPAAAGTREEAQPYRRATELIAALVNRSVSSREAANGLPIGMQIVGGYLEDRTTLAFAELMERE